MRASQPQRTTATESSAQPEVLKSGALPPERSRFLRHLAAASLVPGSFVANLPAMTPPADPPTPIVVKYFPNGAAAAALEEFSSIDKDDNGLISQPELSEFATRDDLSSKQTQVAATLVSAFPGLVTMTLDLSDGLLYEWEISRSDLKKFIARAPQLAQEQREFSQAYRYTLREGGFERIDSNKDEALSREELQVGKRTTDESCAPASAHLLSHYSEIKRTNNNRLPREAAGITKDDILYHRGSIVLADGGPSAMVQAQWTLDSVCEARSARLSDPHWNSLSARDFSFHPLDVQQGQTGNCYFLASTMAVAHVAPLQLRALFTDAPPGTFRVQFSGDPNNIVELSMPNDIERSLFANVKGGHTAWVSILEKAAGLYVQKEGHSYIGESDGRVCIFPAQWIGGGGWAENSLRLITGVEAKRYELKDMCIHQTADVLSDAFRDGGVAVVASSAPRESEVKVDEIGIIPNHAYAVFDFIVGPSCETSQVIIVNPHGDNPHSTEAAITITLPEFAERFSTLHAADLRAPAVSKSN